MQAVSSSFHQPTPRQRQLIDGVSRGLTNKEIAAELGVAVPTVKTHLQLLFARMNARSRSHLARLSLDPNYSVQRLTPD